MDENNVAIHTIINPYYAISIDPRLADEHDPLISREQWVEANLRLLDEIGAREWLEHLLAVLEGDYVVGPDDPDIPGGYKMAG